MDSGPGHAPPRTFEASPRGFRRRRSSIRRRPLVTSRSEHPAKRDAERQQLAVVQRDGRPGPRSVQREDQVGSPNGRASVAMASAPDAVAVSSPRVGRGTSRPPRRSGTRPDPAGGTRSSPRRAPPNTPDAAMRRRIWLAHVGFERVPVWRRRPPTPAVPRTRFRKAFKPPSAQRQRRKAP